MYETARAFLKFNSSKASKAQMNRHMRLFVLVLLSLLALSVALPKGRKCGTKRPIPSDRAGAGKSIPACGLHECDDPEIRNTYLVNANTPVTTMNLHVVYLGDLSGTAKTTYDAQMAFFKQEYMKFFKIGWNITTTVVTDRYQQVDSADEATAQAIATEFYIPGKMTLIWTAFSPNTDNLLGYAYSPQDSDLVNYPEAFFCILDIPYALAATGTTILHEIGHMFGLIHPFIEDATPRCNSCVENVDDVNRDILGDLCNDTLPVPLSYECDALDGNTADCHGNTITDLTGLPQNNYMAYTPDSCQNMYTKQQAARARCYLDKLLQPYVASVEEVTPSGTTPTAVPTSTPITDNSPTTGNTPSQSNAPVKTPITKAVSDASRAGHVLVTAVIAAVSLMGL